MKIINKLINICNISSMLLRHMGQVCPSSIICWLQSAQNFPSPHGIKIHVEFRGPRHTVQLLPPMLVTSSSSFSSVSSESLRAIGLNFLHPIVLLMNTKKFPWSKLSFAKFFFKLTLRIDLDIFRLPCATNLPSQSDLTNVIVCIDNDVV